MADYTFTLAAPVGLNIEVASVVANSVAMMTYEILPFEMSLSVISPTVRTGSFVGYSPPAAKLTISVIHPSRIVHKGKPLNINVTPNAYADTYRDESLSSQNQVTEYNEHNVSSLMIELRALAGDIYSLTEGKRKAWEEAVIPNVSNPDFSRRMIRHSIYTYGAAETKTAASRAIRTNRA